MTATRRVPAMTVPTDTPPPTLPTLARTPTEPAVLADAMRSLGFDHALVAAVVLTPTSAVAISADYPQPYTPPEGT